VEREEIIVVSENSTDWQLKSCAWIREKCQENGMGFAYEGGNFWIIAKNNKRVWPFSATLIILANNNEVKMESVKLYLKEAGFGNFSIVILRPKGDPDIYGDVFSGAFGQLFQQEVQALKQFGNLMNFFC
jgi:hypothetical protein